MTQNKISRAMKAHGVVALRQRLNERGATDLPELSPTHQAMLGGLTLKRMLTKQMTRKEWIDYADYVLAIAKDAQKSLAEYKLEVRKRCKAELAEAHAVHRHMPRHRTARKPAGSSKSKSKPSATRNSRSSLSSATRNRRWVYPASGNKPHGMSVTEWRIDPKNPNNA